MIKTGFIQFNPAIGKVYKNIQSISSLLKEIKGAELIVLPELSNSGYNFTSFDHAYECSEAADNSVFLEFLSDYCQKKSVYIVTGFNENDKGILYNTAVLIGPEGIAGKYRKVHLFMNEKDIFEPGNLGFPVFDIGKCKIGIQICFDYLFPESWRILGMKGADIICHPSNFVTAYPHKVIPAHAVINRMFIVTANRTGKEGDLTFTGGSSLINPNGEYLYQASSTKKEAYVSDIDQELADEKMITERNHVFSDRFPEQYKDLTC